MTIDSIKAALAGITVYGGPWEVGELLKKRRGLSDAFELQNAEDIFGYVYCGTNEHSEVRPVVDFIAACNPAAISELLSSYEAHQKRIADLEEALKQGRSFAKSWIEEHGGIDGCDMSDRLSYEQICAALRSGEKQNDQ